MSGSSHRGYWAVLASVCVLTAAAAAGPIEVIYTEIPGHPTAVVPGARDASGNLVYAEFTVFEDLAMRPDGGEWMLKGRCNLGSALDTILILGSGTSGWAFAQDGQPLLGGVPGEQYDFFDSPVPASWNDYGHIGFSCRAKGGSTSIAEKVIVFDGITHTVIHKQSDPAYGLIDVPGNPTGDELFGNSINSVHMLNNGDAGFVNTPIQNCHSSRYPAFFRGNTSFRQSGVSLIEGEVWDNFDYDDCGGTADGLHWFAKGDTENPNTAIDDILAVDDVIVLREGSPVAGSSVTMAAVFFTRMLSDGTWFCRGDDPADNDWAVRNGVLMAKTGDAIAGGEHWGNTFSGFNGNRVGDWLLIGNTDIGDPSKDYVMVLNGDVIVAREGDPIDLDGNGQFDDDVYLNLFKGTGTFLTDSRMVYFLATLRNGAGTNLGDTYLRLQIPLSFVPADMNCDGVVDFGDINPFVLALSDPAAYASNYPLCDIGNGDINGDGEVGFGDINPFVQCIVQGGCP